MNLATNTVIIVPAAIVVGAIVLAILIFKAMWRVAEPNEALIISRPPRERHRQGCLG
jgi:uncharacterized membrane protein YqiK